MILIRNMARYLSNTQFLAGWIGHPIMDAYRAKEPKIDLAPVD